MSRRGLVGIAAVVVVLVAAAVAWRLLAPRPAAAPSDTPEVTLERLLELRRSRSRDASAYAQYFADPEVATEMARLTESESATRPPVPEWEKPYVSRETSSDADVVVVWRASKDFPGWPKATVFAMQRAADRWVVADAQPATGTVPPPLR